MVVAYLRVSTAHQHLDNQRGEIIAYADRNNIVVDKWITDIVSGKTDKSKRNLGRLLRILKPGDTLIVTEISRLSRSLHEIMTIMKLCTEKHVSIHSTKDGYVFDDSINSKVLSFAFGLAAEIEHKLISQRTKEAMALRKAEGKHMGRIKGSGLKMNALISQKSEIIEIINSTNRSLNSISKEFGVSSRTFHRFKELDQDVSRAVLDRNNTCHK